MYQVYELQKGHTDEGKSEYMEMLEGNIDVIPDDITIIMGNLNARVGEDRRGL